MGIINVAYSSDNSKGVRDWHKWKAWYPVILDGWVTWHRVIERRFVCGGLNDLSWPIYEYREVQEETSSDPIVTKKYKLDKKKGT